MFNNETLTGFSNRRFLNCKKFFNLSKNNMLTFEDLTEDTYTFANLFFYYANLAVSKHKWDLPKVFQQIDPIFIEKLLFYKGRCAIVRDKSKGFLLCDFVNKNVRFNMLGYPTKIQALDILNNEQIGEYSSEDFVIIENNPFWYPTVNHVWNDCTKMADLNESMDTNVNAQKIPIVFQGRPEQKTTMQSIMSQIKTGLEYIFLNKDYNVDDIKTLDINRPFIAEQILNVLDRRKNELLTKIGIENENVNKLSGISESEVNANSALVNLTNDVMLNSRQKACKELKEKFNIDVSVYSIQSTNEKEFNLKEVENE